MIYLGVGRQDDLLLKAAREGIPVLALFNVEVKFNVKTNLVTNETELILFDVAKKAKLDRASTGKFNNLKVQSDRTNNKDDGLQKAFADFFKVVDETLVVSPFPSGLKPEHVKGRVSSLATAKHEMVLPVLVEIRYWQRKNMLSEEELVQAYKQLLGEEAGQQLATGDEETKKKIVEKWLPKL